MDKSEALSLIADKIAVCTLCKLADFRCKNAYLTVPGEGHPNAKIMIVAEAPGSNEAITGRPFVGRSGKLLTRLLNEIGIDREDVFICNTIKCRPPDNRDPTQEETQKCRPYLDLQIDVIKPKYIVCLGKVAALNLLKPANVPDKVWFGKTLGSFRCKLHDYKDSKVLVTFHPSYILRSRSFESVFIEDMGLILKHMKSEQENV